MGGQFLYFVALLLRYLHGDAYVGHELGERGVGVREDSRSRMTSSLAVISRVLVVISKVWVVMVDRFRLRWYTTSSRQSRVGMVQGRGSDR